MLKCILNKYMQCALIVRTIYIENTKTKTSMFDANAHLMLPNVLKALHKYCSVRPSGNVHMLYV